MNRRRFFVFATGGVVSAPLALIGDKPVPVAAHAPKQNVQEIVVTVDTSAAQARIRALVQEGIRQAHQDHLRGLDTKLRDFSMRRG